ncbi:protein of unknown function [Taphrina deformans PYCC 5710]|uniref:Uncharacterized protein n=1 Tax=Taphrina deformans (strain PYCC 5710 / ATCC 11124 / CBS 356.35 / IMI 108563 / JCM 9778 / NBRC 8474) TaxID=1097556 RepID=R4XA08_TAPDE|nr:protein of unknown function [Taphrina deformans PYCC 5710]|eukprot:CCG82357.1 protein of unknown function [Taphrina deformans PYCC 5710]
MPPKKSTEESHIKLKRARSTIFLTVPSPANPEQVKSALLEILRAAPAGIHTAQDGKTLDLATLTPNEIELGAQNQSSKTSDASTERVIDPIDAGDPVSAKVLFWRIQGEEFNIEEYPDDEDNAD